MTHETLFPEPGSLIALMERKASEYLANPHPARFIKMLCDAGFDRAIVTSCLTMIHQAGFMDGHRNGRESEARDVISVVEHLIGKDSDAS